jgi:hypothetical protein
VRSGSLIDPSNPNPSHAGRLDDPKSRQPSGTARAQDRSAQAAAGVCPRRLASGRRIVQSAEPAHCAGIAEEGGSVQRIGRRPRKERYASFNQSFNEVK